MILTTRAFLSHFFQCRWHQGFMLLVKISVETLSLSLSLCFLPFTNQQSRIQTVYPISAGLERPTLSLSCDSRQQVPTYYQTFFVFFYRFAILGKAQFYLDQLNSKVTYNQICNNVDVSNQLTTYFTGGPIMQRSLLHDAKSMLPTFN